MRLQQTRFERQIAEAGPNLNRWASNPWRRLSLLLIVLLSSFVLGGAVGSISGALSKLDPLSALVTVVGLELAVRVRGSLRRRPGDQLGLQMLDMARIGLLYGLLFDGFKVL